MKTFLIIVLCVVLASVAGWLTFSLSGDKATISIDKKVIREDARKAVDSGKDLINRASEKVRDR